MLLLFQIVILCNVHVECQGHWFKSCHMADRALDVPDYYFILLLFYATFPICILPLSYHCFILASMPILYVTVLII